VRPLSNVSTLVITGRMGAGKSTLIARLVQGRPSGQTWAVLVNERGAVHVEAREGVAVAEVGGGCMCCTAQLNLRVALTRLLREVRPSRLFVELHETSHVAPTLRTLASPWLAPVLALGPVVMVIGSAAGETDRALVATADVLCVRGDASAAGRYAAGKRVVDADVATLADLYGTTVNEPR
jgi:G3E family GTPase